ncbi:MAG: YnbE family lipoprotein [Desulfobacteraceae bacterium]|nr:YnbE family lipoprotein [Desulfobacteraceae bacterium]MBC2750928.1 hypothetical protein [Desulfobacteraceae bacterium]
MRNWQPFLAALALLLVLSACTSHRVEVAPVEVKPIHITIDVNVKIDRELDNYLDDIFEAGDDIRQQQGISQ